MGTLLLSKYIAVSRISFKRIATYKADIFVDYCICCITYLVQYFIWSAVFRDTGTLQGLDYIYIVTYFALVSFTRFFSSSVDGMIAQRINSGDIIFELIRPFNFMAYYLSVFLFDTIIRFVIISVPLMAVFSVFIPFRFPENALTLVPFFISLLLSFFLINFIGIIFGMSTVFVKKNMGLIIFKNSVIAVLAGVVIPIHLFPQILQNICEILPFRSMIQVPFDIFLEKIPPDSAFGYIGIQLAWVAGFFLLAVLFVNYCRKKVDIMGG